MTVCVCYLATSWRRRDPPAWVVALTGIALGLGLFLLALALVVTAKLAQHLRAIP
jgi:hypothetical protein